MALDLQKLGALASVVAQDLDDIPDLPEYKAPNPGVYKLLIDLVEEREINDKTAIVVEYAVIDVIQLNQPEDPENPNVKPGDKFSEAFWFNKPDKIEQTLGVLKKKYSGLAEACGTRNLLEIMQKMEKMTIKSVITNRADTKGKTDDHGKPRIYASTREIGPAV
jgi:hypothetical protein